MTRKALGRGLSALLREVPEAPPERSAQGPPPGPTAGLQELGVELIDSSPFQPRANFNPGALEELAQSIRAGGVVQPIVVRPLGGRFQVVAGERRLRAVRLAGLTRIPAVVRTVSDEQALEISLIENLQREELNVVEQARAFERLSGEFGLTQEEIGGRTGKDRATIANTLRLLRLPVDVLGMVEQGKLTAGHARALLRLEASPVLQRVLARRMGVRRVSVRQAEEMVERRQPGAGKKPRKGQTMDPNTQAAVQAMQNALGTRVRIFEYKPHRGRIEIDYYSLEDLDRIYSTIVNQRGTPPLDGAE
ncbi:MAG: ParB/RepB/Spo0J family partition protein [Terriglobia bacterium]